MAGQFNGTPIYILREGSQRTAGREAQRSNIMAAKAVAGAVRTTLGPKGMDKMLVDTMGDVVITNDGVTILKEMDIEHPAAKMMVEIAKTQDTEVGDGTTTAVVLAGELAQAGRRAAGAGDSSDSYCSRLQGCSRQVHGDPAEPGSKGHCKG